MNAATIVGGIHSLTAYLKTTSLNEVWFQNTILIVTAVIALVTLGTTSRQERRRATVDIVRDQQKDTVLIEARALMRKTRGSGALDVKKLLEQTDSAELQAAFTVLNSYEFIATGLKTGAFDIKTYKSMYHNNVVTTWAQYSEFVVEYRKKYRAEHKGVLGMRSDTLFQDLEALATEWQSRPLEKEPLPPVAPVKPVAPTTPAAAASQEKKTQ